MQCFECLRIVWIEIERLAEVLERVLGGGRACLLKIGASSVREFLDLIQHTAARNVVDEGVCGGFSGLVCVGDKFGGTAQPGKECSKLLKGEVVFGIQFQCEVIMMQRIRGAAFRRVALRKVGMRGWIVCGISHGMLKDGNRALPGGGLPIGEKAQKSDKDGGRNGSSGFCS